MNTCRLVDLFTNITVIYFLYYFEQFCRQQQITRLKPNLSEVRAILLNFGENVVVLFIGSYCAHFRLSWIIPCIVCDRWPAVAGVLDDTCDHKVGVFRYYLPELNL